MDYKLQKLKSNYLQATDLNFENYDTYSIFLEIDFGTSRRDLSKLFGLISPTETENARDIDLLQRY
jgi:hypothetical protein